MDRIQRSFKESVILDDLRKQGKLTIHFYRENLILHRDSNSADLIRWDMGVMFARSYVLQMSDNIKRSKEEALKQGRWIGLAPLGYLHHADSNGEKTIIPDPEKAPFISQLFEMYATGNYSLLLLTKKMKEQGLRTKGGNPVAKSQIESMLKNPFYCGIMNTRKGVFPHYYEPIVSKEVFDSAQTIFQGYHKKPHQALAKPFYLSWLNHLRQVWMCDLSRNKKGKYTYYSCSNAKQNCDRVYVREEVLLDTVASYFKRLVLPDEVIKEITDDLKKTYEAESTFHQEHMNALRREQDRLQQRISRLYDDKYDGLIDERLFHTKVKEYKNRQHEIIEEMGRHEKGDEAFHVTANQVMSLAKRAWELFESSEVDEKRQLLNFVLQNLKLENKKLLVEVREPFNLLIGFNEESKSPKGWGRLDAFRTFQWGSLRRYDGLIRSLLAA